MQKTPGSQNGLRGRTGHGPDLPGRWLRANGRQGRRIAPGDIARLEGMPPSDGPFHMSEVFGASFLRPDHWTHPELTCDGPSATSGWSQTTHPQAVSWTEGSELKPLPQLQVPLPPEELLLPFLSSGTATACRGAHDLSVGLVLFPVSYTRLS